MYDWKDTLIMALLSGTGYMELEMLKDVDPEILSDAAEMLDGDSYSFNELIFSVIFLGIGRLGDEIKMSGSDAGEGLSVFEDIDWACNGADTSVWFVDNAEIYTEFFSDALHTFKENTGFEILE